MMIEGKFYHNISCNTCKHRHPEHITCDEAKRLSKPIHPDYLGLLESENHMTSINAIKPTDEVFASDHRRGINLRTYLAAHAPAVWRQSRSMQGEASLAVQWADALIEELNKEKTNA